MKAIKLLMLLLFVSGISTAQVRITEVNTTTGDVTLTNMGASVVDISGWWLCNFPTYSALSTLPVTGSTMLTAGATATFTWASAISADAECGLYNTNTFTSSLAMEDYLEWGSGGHTRESVAVAAGVWCVGEFLTGPSPYTFTGTAVDYCSAWWASAPVLYNVTFQVDMNNECVSPNGVHIAGSFQGWDPALTALTDANLDGIYDITLQLADGSYEYKFVNGNAWGSDESVPVLCNVNGNRGVTVAGMDLTVGLHCYASCDPCAPATHNVTVQVDMAEQIVSPNGVHLIGNFNAWDPLATPLTLLSGSIYTATISVPAASVLDYKFVNGNTSLDAESVPMTCGVSDGFGGYNREIACVGSDITLNPVCYNQCAACVSSFVNVTFQVDMSNEVVNPIGVFVAGSMQANPWTPGDSPMTSIGGGVYQITFAVPAGTSVEYKYVNGPNWGLEETVPGGCNVNGNRGWTVGVVDETIPLHCFSSCNACSVPPVNVTFQVDMNLQTVSPDGVHLAGSFQAWDPAATLMTDPDLDGVYTVTVALQQGDIVQYKFVNGLAWGTDESVPATCAVSNNREWTVGIIDESVPTVCFGECAACVTTGGCTDPLATNYLSTATVDDGSCTYNVTFQVDMNQQVVSANGVHVAGSFQAWDPAATVLTDPDLDGVYTATLVLQQSSVLEYKFVNGNAWGSDEVVPNTCAVNGNRGWTVGTADELIPVVCYAECAACFVIPGCTDPLATNYLSTATVDDGSCTYNVTFQVDMNQQVVSANGVHVAGSFQGWDPAVTALTDPDLDGVYTVTLVLQQSSALEYKFVNGNAWGSDETVPALCAVNGNRGWTVGTADELIPVVCYAECAACIVAGGCTDPLAVNYDSLAVVDDGSCTYNVTFQVDMNQQVVSANGVHVAGSFQGWNPATTALTDPDLDGVYTVTLALQQSSAVEYKFVNGNAWGSDETVPALCAVNGNRGWTVGTADELIPVVCYAECAACIVAGGCTDPLAVNYDSLAVVDDGSCTYNVTFQVDMNQQVVSANGVHVAGSFQGWDAAATALTDPDLDGVYTVTLVLQQSSALEYKFVNGNAWGSDETVPALCAVNGNRGWTVGTADELIPVVCYAECAACIVAGGCTDPLAVNYDSLAVVDDGTCTYNVTFQVDMNQQVVSANGVHVAGSFQGWDPAVTALTDPDLDGVYTVTLVLQQSSALEYKFVNGNAWGSDEAVPASCAVNGNRGWTVGTADELIPVVCYAECAACVIAGGCTDPLAVNYDSLAAVDDGSCQYWLTIRVDMSNQIVDPSGVHVAGAFQGWDPAATPLTYVCYGIWEATIAVQGNATHEYKFVNGNAWGMDESVPVACNQNNNRFVIMGVTDMVLPIVCYAECAACSGCTDPLFVEFNPFAGTDDGSCTSNCISGCTYIDATNYNASATLEDGSCLFTLGSTCPADFNGDLLINTGDLLDFLGVFGTTCP